MCVTESHNAGKTLTVRHSKVIERARTARYAASGGRLSGYRGRPTTCYADQREGGEPMTRGILVALCFGIMIVGGCSRALTESSASGVIQKWIDSQNGGIVGTSAEALTKLIGPEMIVRLQVPDVQRLLKEGYLEEKTVALSYPNFSGQYSGVFRKVNMFSVLVSEPTVITIDIQTLSNTTPPHVEGQFKACDGPDCEVASLSGSVQRVGPSNLILAFPNRRKEFTVTLERGPTDAIVGHYDATGWGRESHLRVNHVGPSPSDVQQEGYAYRWTNKLPSDTFNGAQLILGHLVVDSCENLLLASETTATASCKTHVRLTAGAVAIFGTGSTERPVEATFGKQPDGTWIGTGVQYTAPSYSLPEGRGGTAELSNEGPGRQAAAQVAHVPVTASKIEPPPSAAINLTVFSSTPSFIVGCSSTFSKSREDFTAGRYLYADDLRAQSMISIAGRPLILKAVSKPDQAYFSQFANEEYTASIKIEKTVPGQRGAETVDGTLTVQRKNGPTVTVAVYGERGC